MILPACQVDDDNDDVNDSDDGGDNNSDNDDDNDGDDDNDNYSFNSVNFQFRTSRFCMRLYLNNI